MSTDGQRQSEGGSRSENQVSRQRAYRNESDEEREQTEDTGESNGNIVRMQVGGTATLHRSGTAAADDETEDHVESPTGRVNYRPGPDVSRLSDRYGVDFVKDGQAESLQRLEDEHGSESVQQWVSEGMTVDTMAKPRDMRAFRQRQAGRPPEVPTDVERRNQASVQRNSGAENDSGPAGEAGAPDAVRKVISSAGTSLDEPVQRDMESKMGGDFSDVQLHTGPQAAAAAESINARAFTVGNHVAFNQGEYDPESDAGKRVLAHELTHVRQQTNGAVSLLPKPGADHPGAGLSFQGMHLQPKLEVSSPDDPAEKEAEAVADAVMEMDDAPESAEESEGESGDVTRADRDGSLVRTVPVSRSGAGAVDEGTESKIQSAVQSGGKPLPSETRADFESKMGADFSDVRVHTGSDANEAANSINAEAFTMGSDIAFASGKYNPGSDEGKELLAHELTHVAQGSMNANRVHRASDKPDLDPEDQSKIKEYLVWFFGEQDDDVGKIPLEAEPSLETEIFEAKIGIDGEWNLVPESNLDFSEFEMELKFIIPSEAVSNGSDEGEQTDDDEDDEDDDMEFTQIVKIGENSAELGFGYEGEMIDILISAGGESGGKAFAKAAATFKIAEIMRNTFAKPIDKLDDWFGDVVDLTTKAEIGWEFLAKEMRGIRLDKNTADLALGFKASPYELLKAIPWDEEEDDDGKKVDVEADLDFGKLQGTTDFDVAFEFMNEFSAETDYGGVWEDEVVPTTADVEAKSSIDIHLGYFVYTIDLYEDEGTSSGDIKERQELRDRSLAAAIIYATERIKKVNFDELEAEEMEALVESINKKFVQNAETQFEKAGKKLNDYKKGEDWEFDDVVLWDTDPAQNYKNQLVEEKPRYAGYQFKPSKFLALAKEQESSVETRAQELAKWAPAGSKEAPWDSKDDETYKLAHYMSWKGRPTLRKYGMMWASNRKSPEDGGKEAAREMLQEINHILTEYSDDALETMNYYEMLKTGQRRMRWYLQNPSKFNRTLELYRESKEGEQEASEDEKEADESELTIDVPAE